MAQMHSADRSNACLKMKALQIGVCKKN